jgi:phospholipid/cholesterol/gamma-HCH transport system substrate-binding protein
MKNKKVDNAKVGMLVLAGLLFLVLTLYMIGKNRNLFGSTFTVRALLNNVNGLVPGNNVRFKGIDVGTVKSIEVASDTSIFVTMTIDKEMNQYIKKNALASIGTDGLMGNKLININSVSAPADPVDQNDIIQSLKPVETDEMLRTLNTTNNNIEKITHNLYEITVKLNSSESLWTLLSDTVITKDLKGAVADFKKAGANTSDLTASAKTLVTKLEGGNGLAYKLFNDTTVANQLTYSLDQIEKASNETSAMMKDLKVVVDDMKQGDGTAGLLLKDTLLRQTLFKSATNIEQGTERFNQNMEALKSNFLFRKYFKKLEKEQKKTTEANNN